MTPLVPPFRPVSEVVNAMTIDVEDYFHVSVFDGVVPRAQWDNLETRVAKNTEHLLALFDEHHVQATFFVLGWVAKRVPDIVRRIAAAGHEVASHGFAHRLVYDQTPAAFRDDVRRAKALLEDQSGTPVRGYRAPSYSVTPRSLWALDVLIEEGYSYDSSIFPIRHDRYGIPLSPRHAFVLERNGRMLVEAPASTTRVGPLNLPIGGGGYFRILPYGWTKWGIERVNRLEGRPAIFYLHPWEIDPNQPTLRTSALGKFRHYRNLDVTEQRLRRLLRDFRFGPMLSVINGLTPVVKGEGRAAPALPYQW
jgi:polysaccharide deacetylase family protein (PEP-CTERM system associated)